RVLRRIRASVEQTTRSLQPALGNAFLCTERGTVPREPDGHASRRSLIAALAVGTEGALARVEHDLGEIEPPCGEAETFERLRRFLHRQQVLENAVRLRPIALIQR